MAKVFEQWTVLPHKDIVEHAPNFWTVSGTMPNPKNARVMSLARLADGRVVIHNAIALQEPAMKKIEAWGKPAFLVVPGGFHRQDAKIYKQRYPDIAVLCPEGAKKNVGQVVAPTGFFQDLPTDSNVSLRYFDGMKKSEGYLHVRSGDEVSAVVNDAICNIPKGSLGTDLFMAPTGMPSVPRVIRWMLVKDKRALKASIEALAAEPGLKRVVLAHGEWLTNEPGAALRRVASQV